MALVCRQISAEYLLHCYSNVTIYFNLFDGWWTSAKDFSTTPQIQALNPALASRIRQVKIKARTQTSRRRVLERTPFSWAPHLSHTSCMETVGYASVEYTIQWIHKAQRFVISQIVLERETIQSPVLPDRCETLGISKKVDFPVVGVNGTGRLVESMEGVLRKAKAESAKRESIGLGRDALGELLELVLKNQSLNYLDFSTLTEQEQLEGGATSI